MDKHLLKDWKRHPVTIGYLELVAEHLAALKEALVYEDVDINSIGRVNKIKGQINTLEMILDTDSFLAEKITKEVLDDGEDAQSF